MQIIQILKRFFTDELVPQIRFGALDEKQSLLETGILDSLRMMKLVAFIENEFKIEIGDEDLIPSNFETLSSITELISSNIEQIS